MNSMGRYGHGMGLLLILVGSSIIKISIQACWEPSKSMMRRAANVGRRAGQAERTRRAEQAERAVGRAARNEWKARDKRDGLTW